jgi:hypothetical protein
MARSGKIISNVLGLKFVVLISHSVIQTTIAKDLTTSFGLPVHRKTGPIAYQCASIPKKASLGHVDSHLMYVSNRSIDGHLPRIEACPDMTFCCDNDPDCCSKGKGVKLDGRGNIVSSSTSQISTSTTLQSILAGTNSLGFTSTVFRIRFKRHDVYLPQLPIQNCSI